MGSHQETSTVTVPGAVDQVVSAYDDAVVHARAAATPTDHELGRTDRGRGFAVHRATPPTRQRDAAHVGSAWTASSDQVTCGPPPRRPVTYGLKVADGDVDGSDVTLPSRRHRDVLPSPSGRRLDRLAALAAPVSATSTTYDVGQSRVNTTLVLRPRRHGVRGDASPRLTGLRRGTSCDLGSYPSSLRRPPASAHGSALTCTRPSHDRLRRLDLSRLSDCGPEDPVDRRSRRTSPQSPASAGGHLLRRQVALPRGTAASTSPTSSASPARPTTVADPADRRARRSGPSRRAARRARPSASSTTRAEQGVVGLSPVVRLRRVQRPPLPLRLLPLRRRRRWPHDDPELAAKLAPGDGPPRGRHRRRAPTPRTSRSCRVFDAVRRSLVGLGHLSRSPTATTRSRARRRSTPGPDSRCGPQAARNTALQTRGRLDAVRPRPARRRLLDRADLAGSRLRPQSSPSTGAASGTTPPGSRPEPAAMLGIQLIPMSPLLVLPRRATPPGSRRTSRRPPAASGFDQQFGDYVLMYSALAGGCSGQAALDTAEHLPATRSTTPTAAATCSAFLMSHQ